MIICAINLEYTGMIHFTCLHGTCYMFSLFTMHTLQHFNVSLNIAIVQVIKSDNRFSVVMLIKQICKRFVMFSFLAGKGVGDALHSFRNSRMYSYKSVYISFY